MLLIPYKYEILRDGGYKVIMPISVLKILHPF